MQLTSDLLLTTELMFNIWSPNPNKANKSHVSDDLLQTFVGADIDIFCNQCQTA